LVEALEAELEALEAELETLLPAAVGASHTKPDVSSENELEKVRTEQAKGRGIA
jgi:hypothetical protein